MKRWPPPFHSHSLFNKLLSELPRDSCSPRLCCFSGWLILKLFGLKVSLRWKWRMPESHHSCASVLSCSVTSDSLWPPGWQPARLLCPWGFSRQEYWSELPCPPPGDLPNPGIELGSLALQEDSLPVEPAGKPTVYVGCIFYVYLKFKEILVICVNNKPIEIFFGCTPRYVGS